MARRATSPAKKQTKAQAGPSAMVSEAAETQAPRRARKAKPTIAAPIEPSLTDALFPGGDEPMEMEAEVETVQPVKARRGRKPKMQPDTEAPTSMAADNDVPAEAALPELAPNSEAEASGNEIDHSASSSESPRKTRRGRVTRAEGQPEANLKNAASESPAQQAAARWDADTGTATFDWPSIEQVAAMDGPNQALAKLLLAARAEGANSRWPF